MKKNAHALAVFGALSQLAIPIGIVIFLFQLQSAKSAIDLSDPQDINRIVVSINQVTQQMAAPVNFILWGFLVALLGLIPFVFAITRLQYRRPWAFWFACFYGSLLIFVFPIGTVFGVFLVIYTLTRPQEFRPAPTPAALPS